MYIGDSYGPDGTDRPMAAQTGLVVNVGEPVLGLPGQFVNAGGGYQRSVDLIRAASAALRESGRPASPISDEKESHDPVWTFEHKAFPAQGRFRVRVGGSGYVHAGVTQADGRWAPIYELPLIPVEPGTFEAVLPADIDAFTFFWTEMPPSRGHPGHWERQRQGGRVFRRPGGT